MCNPLRSLVACWPSKHISPSFSEGLSNRSTALKVRLWCTEVSSVTPDRIRPKVGRSCRVQQAGPRFASVAAPLAAIAEIALFAAFCWLSSAHRWCSHSPRPRCIIYRHRYSGRRSVQLPIQQQSRPTKFCCSRNRNPRARLRTVPCTPTPSSQAEYEMYKS